MQPVVKFAGASFARAGLIRRVRRDSPQLWVENAIDPHPLALRETASPGGEGSAQIEIDGPRGEGFSQNAATIEAGR